MDIKRFKSSHVIRYFATIWWILQGLLLICIASFSELIYVESFVITCAVFKNCKKQLIRILTHIGLIIYTIVSSIIFFMLIAVANPTKEGVYLILTIGILNILFSIIDTCKLLCYIFIPR